MGPPPGPDSHPPLDSAAVTAGERPLGSLSAQGSCSSRAALPLVTRLLSLEGGGLTKLSASASAYAPAVHGCASLASRSLDCHPGLKPVRESGRNYQTIRLASFASGPLRPRLGVRSHTMPLVSN